MALGGAGGVCSLTTFPTVRRLAHHENKFPCFVICKALTYNVGITIAPSQKIKGYNTCIVLSTCPTRSGCFINFDSFSPHFSISPIPQHLIIKVQRISRDLMLGNVLLIEDK